MTVLQLAQKAERKYGTNRPDVILAGLGVKVFEIPMSGVRGIYKRIKRNTIIFINSDLDERTKQFVLGHELGHHLLHRGENRVFLDRCTELKTSTQERQADTFSVCLMATCPQDYIFEGESLDSLCCRLGVNERLAQLYLDEVARNGIILY